jgi:Uma2 family endonuclease
MEAQSKATRWTYPEFARLPSEGSTRYEVIAGELVVTPGPSPRHQEIAMRLSARLHDFVDGHGLGAVYPGPIDVLFAEEGDYVEPDIVFVRQDHRRYLTDRGIEGPPDLIVEILSPSTAARDRGIKLGRYRHFGVPEYWVVDPDARAIEVWRLAEGAVEPEIFGSEDTLRWRPVGAVALEIVVGDVVVAED